MKFSALLITIVNLSLSISGATSAGEIDFEFIDYLQSVEDCYRKAENMPQETEEQLDRMQEFAWWCDEEVEMRSFHAIFRQAEAMKEHLFILELAVAALQEYGIDGDEKNAELEAWVKQITKINNILFLVGYMN